MAKLGIHSYSLESQNNEFFRSVPAFIIAFLTIVFTLISCFLLSYENNTNSQLALDAAMTGMAGVQGSGMFVSIGLQMSNTKALQIKLQMLIDSGNLKTIHGIKC